MRYIEFGDEVMGFPAQVHNFQSYTMGFFLLSFILPLFCIILTSYTTYGFKEIVLETN